MLGPSAPLGMHCRNQGEPGDEEEGKSIMLLENAGFEMKTLESRGATNSTKKYFFFFTVSKSFCSPLVKEAFVST